MKIVYKAKASIQNKDKTIKGFGGFIFVNEQDRNKFLDYVKDINLTIDVSRKEDNKKDYMDEYIVYETVDEAINSWKKMAGISE